MPRRTNTPPSLCRHKATDRAYIKLDGRRHYLGKWDSREAESAYKRFCREWLLTGQPPVASIGSIEILEIACDYLEHAEAIYSRDGKPSSEYLIAKVAIKRWKKLYGETSALKFGPVAFKAVRQSWMDENKSRGTITHYLRHIRKAVAFAVENEKLPVDILTAIQSVAPIRRNQYQANPARKLGPVADAIVNQTIPHLPRQIRDMVQIQRLTGMRPGEVVIMRPCDVQQNGKVWHYEPQHHKTEGHDIRRVIAIGKRGQAVLRDYLNREPEAYCFSPAEAIEEIRAAKAAARTTWPTTGNRRFHRLEPNPKRTPRDRYDTVTYCRRITDICERHGIPKWSPNQLRKSFATEARKVGSLEHAQSALGHTNKRTTERYYAEIDMSLADAIVKKIG